jgi:hypothetical protein
MAPLAEVAAIATELTALCLANQNDQAIDKFYSPDIVNVEACDMPHMQRESHGLQAVREMGKWWFDVHEPLETKADGPFVSVDRFAVLFDYKIRVRATGKEQQIKELAIYTVKGGKIVRAEFLYPADMVMNAPK